MADPTLSYVVPAHDVAPYLETCLRSLLGTQVPVEVIVVDDASTDGTAALLAAWAGEDPRVRSMRNEQPCGPGPARNRGLQAATGDFVWFVDADDWLLDGAVETVIDRLRATDADVAVVDHVRAYPSGRLAPSGARFLREAAGAPFTLSTGPRVVEILHTPWNKVVARSLLLDNHVHFSASPVYEDLRFTYSVLSAARRIVAIPEACYAYRTGRPGALTRTTGAVHLCWATEWRSVLESTEDEPLPVRQAVFRRMLWHGWSVLGLRNGRRLPFRLRGAFLAGMVNLHRDLRPDGVRPDPVLWLGSWPVAELRVLLGFGWWVAGRAASRIRRRTS